MKEILKVLHRLLLLRRVTVSEMHLLILFLVIGFPVVVDLANGFMIQVVHSNFSLGVLYRGLTLVLLSPFLLLVKEFWVKLFLALLVAMWLLGNVFWADTGLEYSLVYETNVFSKVLYAWVLYGYLSFAIRNYGISVEYPMKFLVFFGVVAALSIVFSYFTGYGISTYQRASTFAVKSYFKSQNDIGLTMLISLVFCMYFFARYGRWMYGLYAAITMTGLILLGTRAGVLGGFATLLTFTTLFIVRTLNSRKRSGKRVLLVGFMLGTIIVGLVYTITITSGHRYLTDKYSALLESSPRKPLEVAAEKRLDERGALSALVGEGDNSFGIGVLKYYPHKEKAMGESADVGGGKSVEQDIYDLVGSYGLLLGGFILLVTVMMFFKVALGFLVSWRLLDFTFAMAFALLLVHAFLAGHALRSAVVASAAALIYFYTIDMVRPLFKRKMAKGYPGPNAA